VVTRAATERFIVGTTSAGANRIAQIFEEWLQCEWPRLKVFATSVTHQWAVITLSGPRARDVLAAIGTDIDLAPAAFPPMHFRQGRVGGINARVFRVSFTGEVSFEVNVPARAAPSLWARAIEAGQPFGLAPFGVESLMVLRTEKGYLHVGSETDGTTVPDDVGMGAAVARKTSDFIGCRSLSRPEATRAGRLQLVGLLADDPAQVLPVGAHVVPGARAGGSDGYVTSSCFSPALGRGVALAMIRDGRRRKGESVTIFDQGSRVPARVVAPCFFDPEGKRLDG
jgi:sarcosine oxidase subunit alpha